MDSLNCWLALTAQEKIILRDVVEIPLPFGEATDAVQVDLHSSSGFVLLCIRGLKHEIGKMTLKYHSLFVKKLNSSLHSRMLPYEMNNTYILAAALDPRFKLFSCHDDDEKMRVKSLLIDKTTKVIGLGPTPSEESQEDTDEPQEKKRFSFSLMSKKLYTKSL